MNIKRSKQNLIPIGLLMAVVIGSVFVFTANSSLSTEQAVQAIPVSINGWIVGETQGDIQGGSTEAGKEGTIEILGFSHSVISPRDAASGLPTGKRQHKPVTITKEIDKATPLLFAALGNNEEMEIIFRFYRFDKLTGTEVNYYTIELEGAAIASFSQYESLSMGGEAAPPQDVISFVYTRITWTWEDGGLSFTDDWEDPVV